MTQGHERVFVINDVALLAAGNSVGLGESPLWVFLVGFAVVVAIAVATVMRRRK